MSMKDKIEKLILPYFGISQSALIEFVQSFVPFVSKFHISGKFLLHIFCWILLNFAVLWMSAELISFVQFVKSKCYPLLRNIWILIVNVSSYVW